MTKENALKLLQSPRFKWLVEHAYIKYLGYSGVIPNGNLVDRRKHPDAIAMQQNSLLEVPKPKSVEHIKQMLREINSTAIKPKNAKFVIRKHNEDFFYFEQVDGQWTFSHQTGIPTIEEFVNTLD